MSLTIIPNSGIMSDDRLDKLRGDAISACVNGIPEPLVHYLHALERQYLDMRHNQKLESAREIGWKANEDPNRG